MVIANKLPGRAVQYPVSPWEDYIIKVGARVDMGLYKLSLVICSDGECGNGLLVVDRRSTPVCFCKQLRTNPRGGRERERNREKEREREK